MTQFFVNFNSSISNFLDTVALVLPFSACVVIVIGSVYAIVNFKKFIKLYKSEVQYENQQNKTN